MRWLNGRLTLSALATLLAIQMPTFAWAQNVPDKTKESVQLLQTLQFEQLATGVSVAVGRTFNGVRLHVLEFDSDAVDFELVEQVQPTGSFVSEMADDALIAFNGGFFAKKADGARVPVGLLRVDGKTRSPRWTKTGGFLAFGNMGLQIVPTNSGQVPKAANVLQSKPVLIEPGGKWAMNTNRPFSKARTIVCRKSDGNITLLLVSGRGLSLFEAGWVMRSRKKSGFFGCDAAIALDGGGSTQLHVSGRKDLDIEGETRVQNAILVKLR